MKRVFGIIIISIFKMFVCLDANSFEVLTHESLSRKAVSISPNLNALFDVNAPVNGKRIIDWIADGSISEDDGLRFLNHFHNPLRTWNQAGLLGGILGTSSIVWGQNPSQGSAWQNARDEYFLGLTRTT